ncbi:thioredoxin [Rhodothalassium salexigens DSM 2132]|uniref:Thioredoxin n=1 Tax=Rhodothalassium salexigens DSM 2132 TaxID=1188247 RepID=A0A4R2PN88_RHOSA|nr:thioredoxin [Rhodothalassium salexigens]MBB4210948.1 thioredoxin 1 [Rhodothalassium salexigens DSM 2132]MBK1639802.1 thioredoxin [Rhodothalassium salexigens DSM 2132]TCP36394.1 thioredoxin [Rhodothalassium salexigens DSM 2132]
MATTQTSDASFEQDVLKSDKPVLVDFWAEWCGPCKQLGPILEDLAAERSDITVTKLNIDDNPQKPVEFGVRGIPTIMLFKDGQLQATKVGLMPKGDLNKWIDDAIA